MTDRKKNGLGDLPNLLPITYGEEGAGLPGTRPDLTGATGSADKLLSEISTLVPPVEPPAGLYAAVETEIDRRAKDPFETLRSYEGQWIKWADNIVKRTLYGDKIWKKVLFSDEQTGQSIYLLRCEPDAVIPAHKHDRDEHVFVIEGEFVVGNTVVKAGDYQFSGKGSQHPEIRTSTGCLALIYA
jgi:quercetin dioxygenase-like cupin family protein